MNARIPSPTARDNRLLHWLSLHPGARISDVAKEFGLSMHAASLAVKTLRGYGWVEGGYGNTRVTEAGQARLRVLGMETRVSMECPLNPFPPASTEQMIEQLRSYQDPLLRQANDHLRSRVADLEAEVVRLRNALSEAARALGEAARL